MVSNGLRIGGAIVFWSLGDYFYRRLIQEGWDALGFAKYVPQPRPHTASLKDALGQIVGTRQRLIRPLKNRDGFSVTEEIAGEYANSYEHYVSAKITSKPDEERVRISFEPFREYEAEKVIQQFNKFSGYVTNNQVSAALVNLMQHLSATTLRPAGGLYWCPDFSLDHLAKVARVVEESIVGGKAAVYVVRNVMDADAIRAVRDAIIAEIQANIERLDNEVLSGDLGERALENRKVEVNELRLKVKEYEHILGQGLGDLLKATEATEEIICKAEILASAGSEVAV